MRFLALCTDYDGTLAHHGKLEPETIAALERFRESGRRLVMVTGREIDDLKSVCPRLDLFERVVAENGALIYRPQTNEERVLGEAPSREFIDTLRARGVGPISVGRSIVATWEPHEKTVLDTIRDLGLELQVIFNKGAVMILPAGVNKATGLRAALEEMKLSIHNTVGIGDAENDHAFLSICECSVAVSNALDAVKHKADFVTSQPHGHGVSELIDEILRDDLVHREPALARHRIVLGTDERGRVVDLSPYSTKALIVGTSGGGKSTAAIGLIERLRDKGYSFCIVDPEGDYDNVDSAVVLGNPERAPSMDECVQLLCNQNENAVINLVGLKLSDRPWFFMTLFARIRDIRMRTGRPHWLIVDEAHHVMPAEWQPTELNQPEHWDGVVMLSVRPKLIAESAVRAVDTIITVGDDPSEMLADFARVHGVNTPAVALKKLESGVAVMWQAGSAEVPTVVTLEPSHTERKRHLRKYAEGELPEDRSFYFRGPEQKLKLRAHNLIQFMELADGVDDDTWVYHLKHGDVSEWLRCEIKDESLAEQVADVEHSPELDPTDSRHRVRKLIEALYTLPAG
jgi:HAD superfamily hydrolase (TIGR01484 family)